MRTGHSAHTASLHQDAAQSNPAGYPLERKAILHLDAIAGSMVFSESEQSENGAGGMVPRYAVRIEDLKPGDVVVVECDACGHTVAIPHTGLVHGLRLQPTDKILDLAPRLRCRECDARGKAVVSVKWQAAS